MAFDSSNALVPFEFRLSILKNLMTTLSMFVCIGILRSKDCRI